MTMARIGSPIARARQRSIPGGTKPLEVVTGPSHGGELAMKMDRSLEASYRFCGDLARREARNFYCAFLLLPPAKRRSMCALYAFLRHTDDLADEPGTAADKVRRSMPGDASSTSALNGRAFRLAGLPALADTVARHAHPRRVAHQGDRRRLHGRRAAPVRDVRRSCRIIAITSPRWSDSAACISGDIARKGEKPNGWPSLAASRCN